MTVIAKSQIEQVNITLSQYGGKNLLDIRSFLAFNGEEFKPTKKGVSLPIEKIDEAIAGLQAARAEAVQKGWIKAA